MSELATRTKELSMKCIRAVFHSPETLEPLIEQALLAERRLAMELAEKIATDHEYGVRCEGGCGDNIAAKLRAG